MKNLRQFRPLDLYIKEEEKEKRKEEDYDC